LEGDEESYRIMNYEWWIWQSFCT